MTNISVSLDEEIIQLIEEILQKDKKKKSRSAVISESLDEYILHHYPSLLQKEKTDLGPSVLSQLKSKKRLIKGPSFRFTKKLHPIMEPWKEID